MTRRGRWTTALVVLLVLVLAPAGLVWWALSTNQLGRLVEDGFRNRLPGFLHIEQTQLNGVHEVVLSGLSLAPMSGASPAATVKRVVITGELWKGHLDVVRLEGVHVALDARNVSFLYEVIKAEVAHKATGAPRLLHLDITGDAAIDGKPFATEAEVAVDATGPAVTVRAHGLIGVEPAVVEVDTEGAGDDLRYRLALKQGRLAVKELCRQLASLDLTPPVPADAEHWLPESGNFAGSFVLADQGWEHFAGEAHATWGEHGAGAATLAIDRQRLRLEKLHIEDMDAGQLDGALEVGFAERSVEVSASKWHPGPKIPLPSQVPTDDVLAALPQAKLTARHEAQGWGLRVALSGAGQAVLAWGPGQPFTIEGVNVPLTLLQKFLPSDVTLAAGRALKLHVVLDDVLREFSAEVEQTRVLWRGWALGTVDGHINAKPLAGGGYDAEVTLPPMGGVRYTGGADAGTLVVDLLATEALMARLKGPSSLPDLRGAVKFQADLRREGDALAGKLRDARLTSLVLPDVLKEVNATIAGDFTVRAEHLQAHVLGQMISGSVRLPGSWLDLAVRRPMFNARFSLEPGVIQAQDILVRATNEQGEPLPDGYSAGMRGRFSIKDLSGSIKGVVDHADLAWLITLMPVPDGRMHGECAVTFTADLGRDGIRSVDGYFLPLDADLTLGPALRATGIKGAVKFRLARPDEARNDAKP